MKPFPVALVFAVVGAVIGTLVGMREVGVVEDRLYPAPGEGGGKVTASRAADRFASPKVEIEEPNFDFGQMERGTSDSHEFLFRNTGGQPLRVEVVDTTCKCTVGESPIGTIPPGGSAPVRLEWTAKVEAGPFRQVATVATNDPMRPSLKLQVEGKVIEAVSLRPGQFTLGRIDSSRAAQASIYVLAFEEGLDSLEVTARMSETSRNPERYRLSVEPVDPVSTGVEDAVHAVRVTAETDPGLPIGRLLDWVRIDTNLPDPKSGVGETLSFQAPLTGSVRGDISVRGARFSTEHSRLDLGKVRSSEGRRAKLFLSFKGEHAADLRGEVIESDPEWLTVDFEPPKQVREGVYHQFFTVGVPPGHASVVRSGKGAELGGVGDGDATLRLSTGHPTTPELDVKVRFVIAE